MEESASGFKSHGAAWWKS